MKIGKFIAFYGINNIGKSTQAHRLVERLKLGGFDAVLLKYPIYDLMPTGLQLNTILRGEKKQEISEMDLQTLFTRNRSDFEAELKKMLVDGKTVVAEDYTGTGIAWGIAKGLEKEWLEELNKNLLKEDVALLLRGKRHLDAREKNHIHEQDDALVEKVDTILLRLVQQYGWKVVDVEGSIEEVAEAVWEEIFPTFT